MKDRIRLLVFEASADGIDFQDRWMLDCESLEGVFALIAQVAVLRCHDHVCLFEHLGQVIKDATKDGAKAEANAAYDRFRTSRAFSRNAVRVFVETPPDDIGELVTAKRWLLAEFPDGMLQVAQGTMRNAWLTTGGWIVSSAVARLMTLPMPSHVAETARADLLNAIGARILAQSEALANGAPRNDVASIANNSEPESESDLISDVESAGGSSETLPNEADEIDDESLIAAAEVFDRLATQDAGVSMADAPKTRKTRRSK